MQKVTLEINNSIYDYIMFFLENIPKNLVNIKKEITSRNKIYQISSISKMKNLQGVGKELYKDIDSDTYIRELRNEW